MPNQFRANPELYAELSTPLDSPRHAEVAGNAFMVDLEALRVKAPYTGTVGSVHHLLQGRRRSS